jgi:diaminopimelate decarboxylase
MRDFFSYRRGRLYVEGVPAENIARALGTPAYVYSHGAILKNYRDFDRAFRGVPHLVCYSMKCNSNLAVLRLFTGLGSGVDIVSQGELFRALKAGADPRKVVFAGVGKTEEEIAFALKNKILMLNVESEQELETIARVARRLRRKAPIALRVNPDIDPKTHPYITTGMKKSKFGIQYEEALRLYRRAKAARDLEIVGIDCHIGSQLTELRPFVDAVKKVVALIQKLKRENIPIRYLDLGGGLGIRYHRERPPSPDQYARALIREVRGLGLTLIFEPGRFLMGNAGVLLTRVLYRKNRDNKKFFIVDAGMNDLIRPAFYDSYHEFQPTTLGKRKSVRADVVGPVCESGDFLAVDRKMPELAKGEYLAVLSAGAYGFAMASNYNSRLRACEVLVKGGRFHVIRRRETLGDLIRGESIPAFLKKARA